MLCRVLHTWIMVGVCGILIAADPAGIWLDVPFIAQEKDGCGAASIAMVMQYWLRQQGRSVGNEADVAQIQRALYSRQAHGIYASQMERYFRDHGFQVFAISGDWSDLQQHLEKGRPLIAALRPSGRAPLHYVVIAGLDSQSDLVLVNDPAQRKLLKQERSSFEREWSAAGKWTLLAVPQTAAH
jgi:ABC-type bacteriocin/lantibiotic exporter with double-glycine peptidase domain